MKWCNIIAILMVVVTWNCKGQDISLLDSAFQLSQTGSADAAEIIYHRAIQQSSSFPSTVRDSIQCVAYFSLGIDKHNNESFKVAIPYYRQASTQCRAAEDSIYEYYSAINLSRCHMHLYQVDSALFYLDKIRSLLDTTDARAYGEYYMTIGWIFQKAKITEDAETAYRKAAETFRSDSLFKLQLDALYAVALTYDDAQNYQKVLQALSECRKVNKIVQDTFSSWLINACQGISEVNLGKYKKGYITLKAAMEIGKKYDKNLCCGNKVFYALAILKNNINNNVDSILDIALNDLSTVIDQRDRRNIYQGLYLCYDEMGKSDKALQYHKLYTQATDSLHRKDYVNQLALMQYQESFRALKSQLKFTRVKLEHSNRGYKRSIIIAISLSILVTALLFVLYRWRKYRYSYSYDLAQWNKIARSSTSEAPENILTIKQAKNYVKKNVHSGELNGTEIARELHISLRKFNKILKTNLNLTSAQFINVVRIRQAQKLLMDESRSISQIAYDIGFSDPAYFSRIFKKIVKQNPSEWRLNSKREGALSDS